MGSWKREPDNNRNISDHTRTLHFRLLQALDLGTRTPRPHERHGRKWLCTDIQIQKQVVLSISAFLDSVCPVMLHNPLLKGSVAEIVEALVWILEFKSEVTLSMAADAMLKLVTTLPPSFLESFVLDLIGPLSSLLSYHQTEVATSCATALKITLSNATITKVKEVWDALKRTESVSCAIKSITVFIWRLLYDAIANSGLDSNVKMELRLFSAIALCGDGAKKLLQNGKALLEAIVQCMDSSQPHSVRMEGSKLAGHLALSGQRFVKIVSFHWESFIRVIISEMSQFWRMKSRKVGHEQRSLFSEACSLALITRWGGKHHKLFWENGIDEVLLNLLLENSHKHQDSLLIKQQISIAREIFNSNCSERILVWHILGCLALHCKEDFYPERRPMDTLITCACVAFVDAIQKPIANSLQSESLIRAVLLMIYSPCMYIASSTRFLLSEVLKPHGGHCLKYLLRTPENIPSNDNFNIIQISSHVMALACYIGLPESRMQVLELSGVKTLFTFVGWCLSNGVNEGSLRSALYECHSLYEPICCLVSSEDWDGKEIIVLYTLWCLAELIKHSVAHTSNNLEIASAGMRYSVPELLKNLQDICMDTSAPAVRWFAAYALSSLGLYGFPSKLGNRIGQALGEEYHADIRLILTNGDCLSVHGVILAIRCPPLLRPEDLNCSEETFDSSGSSSTGTDRKLHKEI